MHLADKTCDNKNMRTSRQLQYATSQAKRVLGSKALRCDGLYRCPIALDLSHNLRDFVQLFVNVADFSRGFQRRIHRQCVWELVEKSASDGESHPRC